MIPLIGLLLCIYLIFKGFEIFQIAWCADDPPIGGVIIGVCAIIFSVLIAGGFAYLFLTPSMTMSLPQTDLPRLP